MHKQQRESKNQPIWFLSFILLLLLVPLPFGSNRPWSSDLFALLVGGCLVSLLWFQHSAPQLILTGKPPRSRILFSLIGFSLVAIWSFLQTLPWMPTAWHHPIWGMAAEQLGPIKGSIALNTSLFPEALIRLLSYAGCFLLAFFACRQSVAAARLVRWLAYAAGGYALYGLIMQSTGLNMILWYDKWAYEGFLTSTFVNKNSYAVYAGLGLLCCLGQLYMHMRKVKIRNRMLAKRSKALAFFSALTLKDMAAFIPTIFVLGALALTGSRAGVFSTLIGAGTFILAFAVHKRLKAKQWVWLAGSLGALFILFVSLGGSALISRLDETKVGDDASLRIAAYELSATAISDNPWLGYGLGNFEEAFRIYRDDSLTLWYHHAHNDYLEMMIDLGVPFAFLLFATIGALVSCCASGLRVRKKNGLYPAIALGASALIATHAFVDFSMHIPAIAATYAALLGLGVAQSWSSKKI